jgi:hypothetical protein
MEIAPRSTFHQVQTIPESPFRVKGVLFLGTKTYFDNHVPGGYETLRKTLGPGALRDFMDQRFLPSGLYEVMHVPQLIAAEAAATRQGERSYLRRRTEHQAMADMGGIHKILLKVATPEMIVVRLPKVMTQMYNFGEPTITQVGPREFDLRVDGVPAELGAWLQVALEIYVEIAIRTAGGKSPFVAMQRPIVQPRVQGYPVIALSLRARWSTEDS